MPTPVTIQQWTCDECKKAYATAGEALSCEAKDRNRSFEARYEKLFPRYHPRDTRWKHHCVSCGTLYREYEYVPDPTGPAEVGKTIFMSKFIFTKEFGGLRCEPCSHFLKMRIVEALERNVQEKA